ncbi:thiamine pyrophosphate-dependent enzyme [Amycolatopsis sp. NPDC051045]|uniref:thiamine pyrophosphate-dependent enzyme n=1 Tax=Amycolatopsis sp. NPDC051045 TaxID=3156922 RepID=UPI003441D145
MTTVTEPGYADLPRLISLMTGDEKHSAAAESTLDVLWVLYDRVLDVTPENFREPDRDRFLLSKGHGPMAYYAVLTAKGFLAEAELPTWSDPVSRLGHHPDRRRIPGVEISSGSLGHGLPIALGTALGLRARGLTRAKVVTLVGDAELDEGSNHEAIVVAARDGLENLTTVVIDNQSSTRGWPGGIARRFAVEGWETRTVSGRDHEALYDAFTTAHPGRPLAVVAVVEPKG